MIRQIFTFIAILWTSVVCAEEKITGFVYNENNEPVVGAHVRWQETRRGTTTDKEGAFELAQKTSEKTLVISYVGFVTNTIKVVPGEAPLRIRLQESVELEEVVVNERRVGLVASRSSVLQTQKITYDELCRAACCNLAESFETNPSVDVSYADASTGARQIKLLGLAGAYVQMLTENYPNFRGASSLYGLDYVPGAWMESIQVSKGTSSVKNGYEALTGQINVEFKKPFTSDIFSVNLFASDAGRYEVNSDATWHVSDHVYSGLFVHYSKDGTQHDANGDGFLDMPLKEQVNLMNRWQHRTNKYIAQYGIRVLKEDRTGGQDTRHHYFIDPYRIEIKTNRLEGYTKQAYVINPDKVESVALIVSGSYHEQQSMYDRIRYNVYQKNGYANLMYEKTFSVNHSLSTGLSLNYDGFDENLTRNRQRERYNRSEVVPGVYVQYTCNLNEKFIALAGIRADNSSLYGFFVTPRFHLKYNPFNWFHLRASAGKGYRTANALTENNFLLSSSRNIRMADDLNQEEAWNTGLNFSFYIPVAGRDLVINAEWYHTKFLKQVIIDMDSNPHEVRFYNLEGQSYANSWQIEATYQFPFIRGFTLMGAYRYTDTQTDYTNATGVKRRLKKPLVSDYKGLITASYQTPLKKWQADLTGQLNGGGRMPAPDASNPLWDTNFKPYQIWNIQVTKYFRTWSVYAGAENLLNFKQAYPIIDAMNPRSSNFDGTMIWGPVHGRTIYIGLRYNINREI